MGFLQIGALSLGGRLQQARCEFETSRFSRDVGATLSQLGERAQETRSGLEQIARGLRQGESQDTRQDVTRPVSHGGVDTQAAALVITELKKHRDAPLCDAASRPKVWCHCLSTAMADSRNCDVNGAAQDSIASSSPDGTAWLAIARGEFDGCWTQTSGLTVAVIVGSKLRWISDGTHSVIKPVSGRRFSVALQGRTYFAELNGGQLVWDDASTWAPAVVAPQTVALLPESEDLPRAVCDLIEVDVSRTFASNVEFRNRGGPDKLRRVLRRFATANPDIGYCQSLNLVAGVLIMVFDDERVVPEAIGRLIMKLETRQWYTEGTRQLRADIFVLSGLLHEVMPDVHSALRARDLDLLCICPKWFLSLFSAVLEGEVLLQVWDAILIDGIEAIFRVALALFRCHRRAIIGDMATGDVLKLLATPQSDAAFGTVMTWLMTWAYDANWLGTVTPDKLTRCRGSAIARVASSDGISGVAEVAEACREFHRC